MEQDKQNRQVDPINSNSVKYLITAKSTHHHLYKQKTPRLAGLLVRDAFKYFIEY